MRLTFRDCEVDFGTREAFRGARAVHLSPKAFQLLELLAERRPDAVPKTEIHETVWPNSFVSEATVASVVAEIRAAFGHTRNSPSPIRTVHGFGYAFSAEAHSSEGDVSPDGGTSDWCLAWENREVVLRRGVNVLGRAQGAALHLDPESVSRRHARIVVSEGNAILEDLGSKNGTFVNGERVKGRRPLGNGDEVRLGSAVVRVRRRDGLTTRTQGP